MALRKRKAHWASGRQYSIPVPSLPLGDSLTESQIKHDIIEYLELKKIMCWVNVSTGIWDVKAKRFRKRNGKGMRLGTSDIFFLANGVFGAIEVKRPGGVATDAQLKFIEDVRNEGHVAFIAYSVADVAKYLFNE